MALNKTLQIDALLNVRDVLKNSKKINSTLAGMSTSTSFDALNSGLKNADLGATNFDKSLKKVGKTLQQVKKQSFDSFIPEINKNPNRSARKAIKNEKIRDGLLDGFRNPLSFHKSLKNSVHRLNQSTENFAKSTNDIFKSNINRKDSEKLSKVSDNIFKNFKNFEKSMDPLKGFTKTIKDTNKKTIHRDPFAARKISNQVDDHDFFKKSKVFKDGFSKSFDAYRPFNYKKEPESLDTRFKHAVNDFKKGVSSFRSSLDKFINTGRIGGDSENIIGGGGGDDKKDTKNTKNTKSRGNLFGANDTALVGLGIGFAATATLRPIVDLESNIINTIITADASITNIANKAERMAKIEKEEKKLLGTIRNLSARSTITQAQLSEGVLQLAKDGLRVIGTITSNDVLDKFKTLDPSKLKSTEEDMKKYLNGVEKFTTSDFITGVARVASDVARGVGEPEKFGDIANFLGDTLLKNINNVDEAIETLDLLASKSLQKNLVGVVKNSRFDIGQIASAVRNTIGVQQRVKGLDVGEVAQLVAVFDRIGPSANRIGTSLRRFTQELGNMNGSGIKSLRAANINISEQKQFLKDISGATNPTEFIEGVADLFDKVRKKGKTELNQFTLAFLGTEGERPGIEIAGDPEKVKNQIRNLSKAIKFLNIDNIVEAMENNLKGASLRLRVSFQDFIGVLGNEGRMLENLQLNFDAISMFITGVARTLQNNPIAAQTISSLLKASFVAISFSVAIGGLSYVLLKLKKVPIIALAGLAVGFISFLSDFETLQPVFRVLSEGLGNLTNYFGKLIKKVAEFLGLEKETAKGFIERGTDNLVATVAGAYDSQTVGSNIKKLTEKDVVNADQNKKILAISAGNISNEISDVLRLNAPNLSSFFNPEDLFKNEIGNSLINMGDRLATEAGMLVGVIDPINELVHSVNRSINELKLIENSNPEAFQENQNKLIDLLTQIMQNGSKSEDIQDMIDAFKQNKDTKDFIDDYVIK